MLGASLSPQLVNWWPALLVSRQSAWWWSQLELGSTHGPQSLLWLPHHVLSNSKQTLGKCWHESWNGHEHGTLRRGRLSLSASQNGPHKGTYCAEKHAFRALKQSLIQLSAWNSRETWLSFLIYLLLLRCAVKVALNKSTDLLLCSLSSVLHFIWSWGPDNTFHKSKKKNPLSVARIGLVYSGGIVTEHIIP